MKAESRSLFRRVGEAVSTVRRLRGMTQSELGKAIGLGRTSVVNIEAGRQALLLDTFMKLSKVLGCHPSVLLGLDKRR